jgi:tRNA(Ile)-lysidine synthase TilS/MesJ
MNYIVAVSGGVDSVVLLDMLAKEMPVVSLAHYYKKLSRTYM